MIYNYNNTVVVYVYVFGLPASDWLSSAGCLQRSSWRLQIDFISQKISRNDEPLYTESKRCEEPIK